MRQSPFLLTIKAFLIGVLLTLLTNCRSAHDASRFESSTAAAAFSDRSIYQTQSKWTTDSGKVITLSKLHGRPQVIVMFFSHCQFACPILVHNLQKVESSLKPDIRSRVGFTLVSIDPRRDTPSELAKFRMGRNLSKQTWTLLNGQSDDILELAALLGVQYKEESTGQFAHSNLITVLNSGGEIVRQVAGLGQDTDDIAHALELLVSSAHASAK